MKTELAREKSDKIDSKTQYRKSGWYVSRGHDMKPVDLWTHPNQLISMVGSYRMRSTAEHRCTDRIWAVRTHPLAWSVCTYALSALAELPDLFCTCSLNGIDWPAQLRLQVAVSLFFKFRVGNGKNPFWELWRSLHVLSWRHKHTAYRLHWLYEPGR